MKRAAELTTLAIVAGGILLAATACPLATPPTNIVLVTVESLRADRLIGPPSTPDAWASLRAAAGPDHVRPLLASSSETLPSLASIMTGASPARHATLVEGLDRLPDDLPTLASLLGKAGFRTAGYPTLTSLGLASGLSRGFESFGWPPSDLIVPGPLAGTDGQDWRPDEGRRTGLAAVNDALKWARRHKSEKLFLWIHLSEAAPPYATDRLLINRFQGSSYDAAMAYEDVCVRELRAGFEEVGLAKSTTFLIAGDHGESLGANGESFHGLNLDLPALETALAIIPAQQGSGRTDGLPGGAGGGPGRLQDLYALILGLAGIPIPAGSESSIGLPAVSSSLPLLAVTLAPRSAFGWNGRLAWLDGEWAWSGPQDEELYRLSDHPSGTVAGGEEARARALKEKALAAASRIEKRLAGRSTTPAVAARGRIVDLLRGAAGALDEGKPDASKASVREAWKLDPGNFDVARWLIRSNGPKDAAESEMLVREVEARGEGLPEAWRALMGIYDLSAKPAEALDMAKHACQASGGAGCAVELALRLARSKRQEEAIHVILPLPATGKDADLTRFVGDLYFALGDTHRAMQSYDRALRLRPSDADVLIRQADSLVAMRDYSGAKAKYLEASRLLPDLPLVEMRLGAMAREQGNRSDAVEHFRKGLGTDTNSAAGAVALGRLLTEQNMVEEAIPLFMDAASRDTSSGDALYYASEAYAVAGRLDESEKYLRQSLERDPSNPMALYQLARLQVYRGDRTGAEHTLESLAQRATPDIAVAALRDPLFTNDAPGAPLAKGLQALYEVVKRALPGRGGTPDAPNRDQALEPAAGHP